MKSRTVSKCRWFGLGRIQFGYALGPSGDPPAHEVCRAGPVPRSKWIDAAAWTASSQARRPNAPRQPLRARAHSRTSTQSRKASSSSRLTVCAASARWASAARSTGVSGLMAGQRTRGEKPISAGCERRVARAYWRRSARSRQRGRFSLHLRGSTRRLRRPLPPCSDVRSSRRKSASGSCPRRAPLHLLPRPRRRRGPPPRSFPRWPARGPSQLRSCGKRRSRRPLARRAARCASTHSWARHARARRQLMR